MKPLVFVSILLAAGLAAALLAGSPNSASAAQCSAPVVSVSYHDIDRIALQWNPISGATKYEWRYCVKNGVCDTVAELVNVDNVAKFVSSALLTAVPLNNNTEHMFAVRVAESDGSCGATGAWSAPVTSKTTTCSKRPQGSIPLEDLAFFQVTLQSGAVCPIKVSTLGEDLDDSSPVTFTIDSYTNISTQTGSYTTSMDDNPETGCENNITFKNFWNWNAGQDTLNISTYLEQQSAAHKLGYGFQIVSPSCSFQDTTVYAAGYAGPKPSIVDAGKTVQALMRKYSTSPVLGNGEDYDLSFKLVSTGPALTASVTNATNGWNKEAPKLDINTSVATGGISKVQYKLPGGSFTDWQNPGGVSSWSNIVVLPTAAWNALSDNASSDVTIRAISTSGLTSDQIVVIQKDISKPKAEVKINPLLDALWAIFPKDKDSAFYPGFNPGTVGSCTSGQHCLFFRGGIGGVDKTYTVTAEITDTSGGSGVDFGTIAFIIRDTKGTPETADDVSSSIPRTCSPIIDGYSCTADFDIGNTGHCRTQENNNCMLEIDTTDGAGSLSLVNLLGGNDERDFSTLGKNQIFFGADWTPPTAK